MLGVCSPEMGGQVTPQGLTNAVLSDWGTGPQDSSPSESSCAHIQAPGASVTGPWSEAAGTRGAQGAELTGQAEASSHFLSGGPVTAGLLLGAGGGGSVSTEGQGSQDTHPGHRTIGPGCWTGTKCSVCSPGFSWAGAGGKGGG